MAEGRPQRWKHRAGGLSWGLIDGLVFSVCWVLEFELGGQSVPIYPFVLMLVGVYFLVKASSRSGDHTAWASSRLLGVPSIVLGVWLGAIPGWLWLERWMWDVSAIGYPFVGMILALQPAAFVWCVSVLRRGFGVWGLAAGAPMAWVTLEMFRGEVFFTGYPWFLLGQPMVEVGGSGSLLGMYGMSLVLACIPCGVAAVMGEKSGRVRPVTALVVFSVAAFALDRAVAPGWTPPTRTVRVAVVQSNIAQDNKQSWAIEQRLADFAEFVRMTRDAAAYGADMIVWPETMFPGGVLDVEAVDVQRDAGIGWGAELDGQQTFVPATVFADALRELQGQLGVPMLVGAEGADGLRITTSGDSTDFGWDALYNCVFVVDAGRGGDERYEKVRLTPFGEVMPYIHAWPWLERQLMAVGAHGMSFELSSGAGPGQVAVRLGDGSMIRVATPICFEATMTGYCGRLARAGGRADLFINVTNDGWFGDVDAGRRQHAQAARWRAVEQGIPMVRAANTGTSVAYDARGREIEPTADDRPSAARSGGVVVYDVPIGGVATAYARLGGRLPMTVVSLIGAVGIVVSAWRVRRGSRKEASA